MEKERIKWKRQTKIIVRKKEEDKTFSKKRKKKRNIKEMCHQENVGWTMAGRKFNLGSLRADFDQPAILMILLESY